MPVTHLTDFPDLISPMLVKELRQGMRAKTFISAFLALQVFLAVMLFSAGAASTSDHAGSVISGIIFTFFAIAVLIVQPLRGTARPVHGSEGQHARHDGAHPPQRLAHRHRKMGGHRQPVRALLTTIIPYLILRYFFGGMNLFAELVFLALLFLTSMALTAVTVGLSGCSSVIVRSLIPILGLPVLILSFLVLLPRLWQSTTLWNSSRWIPGIPHRRAAYIACIAWLGGSDAFAGRLAHRPGRGKPLAAPPPRRARPACCCRAGHPPHRPPITEALAAWFPSSPSRPFSSPSPSPHRSPPVCKPFAKLGAPGKAVGWLSLSHWASGILFAILIGPLALAAIFLALRATSTTSTRRDIVVSRRFSAGSCFPACLAGLPVPRRGPARRPLPALLTGSFILLGVLLILPTPWTTGFPLVLRLEPARLHRHA